MSIVKAFLNSAAFNLATAMAIVGSSVICGKIITQDFPLFLGSELRFLVAAALFIPLGIYNRSLLRLPRHDWCLLLLMAFCGQMLFTILLLLGLRYTSGSNAGMLTSTTPFFMSIFSFFVLGERFRPLQWLGLLLTLTSIFFLSYDTISNLATTDSQQWLGNLLVLGAVASEAIFLLLGKKLQTKLSGLSITALLSLLGAGLCLPLACSEIGDFNFSALTMPDVIAMLYFGMVYTDIAYLLWFRGVIQTTGATASAYTALMPLTATLLSALLLQEQLSLLQLIALCTAIASILLLTLTKAPIKGDVLHEVPPSV
ncbi:MAG: DMT family transporter [Selenomonadaceae bacterium]